MASDDEDGFDRDKRSALFASEWVTIAGWVTAVGSFLVGLLIMIFSDDGEGRSITNLPPAFLPGLLLLVIGSLSGLFLVMIGSFVRAHLKSQTVLELEISHLISVIRPQSESPDPDDAGE